MLTELWVKQKFKAPYDLTGTSPPGHRCAALHSHGYEVTLTIGSHGEEGVLVDYHELHAGLRDIIGPWDHRDLEDVFGNKPAACENLAREIYRQAVGRWGGVVRSVEVEEQCRAGCKAVVGS